MINLNDREIVLIASLFSYSVILSNRLAVTVAARVPAAVTTAGLPTSSVASFISAFAVGEAAFAQVPGVTPDILAIGSNAYQYANADAFRTVFFSNIAFSGVAIICSLCKAGLHIKRWLPRTLA